MHFSLWQSRCSGTFTFMNRNGGENVIEVIKEAYSPFSISVITIYRYLREERNEMKISSKMTSLIMNTDELLETPQKENLEKALSNTKLILQNIERLYLSGYLDKPQYESANKSGITFEEVLCSHLASEMRKAECHQIENERSLVDRARQMAIDDGTLSTSTLQRRLKIGYARAAKILDQLEQEGIISAMDGSKPRICLIRKG